MTFRNNVTWVSFNARMRKDLKFIITDFFFLTTIYSCNFKDTIIFRSKIAEEIFMLLWILLIWFVEENKPNLSSSQKLRKTTHIKFKYITLWEKILFKISSLVKLKIKSTSSTTASEKMRKYILKVSLKLVSSTFSFLQTFFTYKNKWKICWN